MQRRTYWGSLLGSVLLAAVGPAGFVLPAADETRPATIQNGGYTLNLNAVSQGALTLNQAPTEIMLALSSKGVVVAHSGPQSVLTESMIEAVYGVAARVGLHPQTGTLNIAYLPPRLSERSDPVFMEVGQG